MLLGFVSGIKAQEDVTSQYLSNADLSTVNSGWTYYSDAFKYTDWKTDGDVPVVEFYSQWSASPQSMTQKDFKFSQTVTLPAGDYRIAVNAFYRYGNGDGTNPDKAWIFAGEKKKNVVGLSSAGVAGYSGSNDLYKAANAFSLGDFSNAFDFTVESEQEITLGFQGYFDRTLSWCILGPVKLYKYSLEDYLVAYRAKVSEAKALYETPMNSGVLADLKGAIVDESTFSYGSQVVAAMDNIDSKIAACNTSIANYQEALVIINAASALDASGQTSYAANETVLEIKAGYDNKTLVVVSDDQKALCQAALTDATKAQTTAGSDWTSLISNPSFETGNFTGWTNNSMATQNNTSFEKVGVYYAEAWQPNGTRSVKQTVSAMPSGVYRLSAKVKARGVTSAKLYANGVDKAVTIADATADYSVEFACDNNADVEIGFEGVGTGAGSSWLCVDNFTLTLVSSGLPDVVPVVGKMNATVAAAQTTAIETYEANRTVANYNAAAAAIAAAQASIDAYAVGKAALDKVDNILANTNVYTVEAYTTFGEAKLASQNGYDNGTWTNDEAQAYGSTVFGTGWRTNATIDDFLISAWDAAPRDWSTYHINTWSTTGDSGNPNFVAPCFEYWTGDNTTLADKTMTATLGGFAPGATYKVAMTVCAGVNTGVEPSTAPTGVTLQLNDGEAVSVCTGDRIAETRFYEGTFEANATIGADGNLVIKLNVASTNASWVTWRDVKYTKIADPVDPTPSREAVAVKLTAAQGLVNEVMNADVDADLNAKIAATAGYEESTDIDALEQMANDLDVAIAAAQTSVANYQEAAAIVNAASILDEAGQAVYNSNNKVLEVKAAYDAKTLVAVTEEQKDVCKDALKVAVKAQTTDGADWTLLIDNPGFEGTFKSVANPQANRDIYQPESWTAVWENGNENDMTSLNSSCTQWNNFAEMLQPADGGNNVYWARYRWGNQSSITLKQTINLPAGLYEVGAEGYLSNATDGKATLSVKFGDEVALTDFTDAAWTKKAVVFSISETQDVEILYNFTESKQVEIKAGVDNFTLTSRAAADADDYAALNAAIKNAESLKIGFKAGEYAPYTNVAVLAPLAAAKAIDQTVVNTKSAVVIATSLLNDAQSAWVENAENMPIVYNGTFVASENDGAPAGWETDNAAGLGGALHARAFVLNPGDGNYDRLASFDQGDATRSAFYVRFDGTNSTRTTDYTYGETVGYTMPLEAGVYRVKLMAGGWGQTQPLNVKFEDAESTIKGEQTVEMTNLADGSGVAASFNFLSEVAAGDYKLVVSNGNIDANNAAAFSNVEITLEMTAAELAALREEIILLRTQVEGYTELPEPLATEAAAAVGEAYAYINEHECDPAKLNACKDRLQAVVDAAAPKTDYTDYIINADLSDSESTAWNLAGTKGYHNSGNAVTCGNNAVFDFCQVVQNLPAGQYKLTAKSAYRYSGSEADEYAAIEAGTETKFASLYAKVGTKTFSSLVQNRWDGASDVDYAAGSGSVVVNEKFVPNSTAAVKAWFNADKYVNEVVFNLTADGDVTIGIAKDAQPAAGDFTVIGGWTLTRLGDAQPEYAITVAPAENGNVVADKVTAAAGETVKVTATPDEGYMVDYGYYVYNETQYDFESIDMEHNIATFTMPAGPVSVVLAFKQAKVAYQFVPSEWGAGDPGRISPENVVANDVAGTITVDKTGANNVNLNFHTTKRYVLSASQRYFVIKATGLATGDTDSYLWWLNHNNNGSQIVPTAIFVENGETVFAWDAITSGIGGTIGLEETELNGTAEWTTTFGMTLADANVPAVISYIGFQETIPEPVEEEAYEFVPSEWGAGDPGRISPENVVADDEMGTITVDKTGDNNVCLLFKTNKLYYVENVDYFVIKAKGVSTETGASYLWWLNGKNDNGAQFAPTSTATETDGTIILEWKISECGNIGENINPVGKSYLLGGEGWTTTFGLTQADALTPVVISYIGYGTKSATAISAAKSQDAEGALKDGKYLIKGEIVIVKNGKLYKANGQLK